MPISKFLYEFALFDYKYKLLKFFKERYNIERNFKWDLIQAISYNEMEKKEDDMKIFIYLLSMINEEENEEENEKEIVNAIVTQNNLDMFYHILSIERYFNYIKNNVVKILNNYISNGAENFVIRNQFSDIKKDEEHTLLIKKLVQIFVKDSSETEIKEMKEKFLQLSREPRITYFKPKFTYLKNIFD